jgi:predicted ATPase
MLREQHLVSEHADALVTLSVKHGFVLWEAWGRVAQGWVAAREGGGNSAVKEVRLGLNMARETGNRIYETTVLGLLGDAEAAAGAVEAGLASIAEGIALAAESRQLYWLSELHRLDGCIRLKARTADRAGAEVALRQAVAVARQQNSPAWELRATNDLAKLLAEDGRAEEGHTALAGVYGRFNEGFETPDLKEAKALLGALK